MAASALSGSSTFLAIRPMSSSWRCRRSSRLIIVSWSHRLCITRKNRLTFSLWVSSDPPHGQVDPEAGRGSLLFALSAPEAVLPLFPGPRPAGELHRARRTEGPRNRFPGHPGLGSLPCRGEEQLGVAPAGGVRQAHHAQENRKRSASNTTLPPAPTVWNAAPSSSSHILTSSSSPGRTGEAKRPEIPPNR